MEPKKVSAETMAIQKRFFDAIDELSRAGKLGNARGGLQAFCKTYGFNQPKYSVLRSQTRDPERPRSYNFIDLDAVYYLVRDYNVSCEWLILNRGKMFKSF